MAERIKTPDILSQLMSGDTSNPPEKEKSTKPAPTAHQAQEKSTEPEIEAPVEREQPALPEQAETKAPHVPKSKAKYQDLEKITVLMTEEQKTGLDIVAKKIMKHRARFTKGIEGKERITTNTLIRALIDNFLENEPQLEVLTCEDDVLAWVGKVFRDNS